MTVVVTSRLNSDVGIDTSDDSLPGDANENPLEQHLNTKIIGWGWNGNSVMEIHFLMDGFLCTSFELQPEQCLLYSCERRRITIIGNLNGGKIHRWPDGEDRNGMHLQRTADCSRILSLLLSTITNPFGAYPFRLLCGIGSCTHRRRDLPF